MSQKIPFGYHSRSAFRRVVRDSRGAAAVEAAMTFPVLIAMMLGMLEMYFYMEASHRVTAAAQLTADLVGRQATVNNGTGPASSTPMSAIFSASLVMLSPMPVSSSVPTTSNSTNPAIDVASILFANPTVTTNNLSCSASTTGPATGESNGVANYCHGIDWELAVGGATAKANTTAVYTNFVNGCTASNLTACYCVLTSASIGNPVPFCVAGQSIIYVRVDYTYTDPIAFFFPIFLGSNQIVISESAFVTPRQVTYVPLCTTASSSSCA